MPLGIAGTLKSVRNRLNETNRYINFAIRFRVYNRIDDRVTRTDIVSPIYGGIFDFWTGKYIQDEVPENEVLEIRCSEAQLEVLESTASVTEASGGRGSGKSEGGILWVLKNIVLLPGEQGRVISPTFPLTRVVWTKLFRQLPNKWIVPGLEGISKSNKEIKFLNGHILQFSSATNPNSLRSWGGSYALVDEAQDVSTEAIDINWFCLRESANPRVLYTLTPAQGEAYQRHCEIKQQDDANGIVFSSFTNPFVDKKVFTRARQFMDKIRYKIEVEADWDTIATLEEEAVSYVFPGFKREEFEIEWPPMGLDKTSALVAKRFNTTDRHDFIIGVDPNYNYPNYGVIYKVFTPTEKGGPDRWIAIDVIERKGHCGHLGEVLKEQGYGNGIIIPDASSRYWKGHGPRSPERLLRSCGFDVRLDRKNPIVTTSVDAMRWRLFPVDGPPSWFFRKGRCDVLVDAMERLQWKADGKSLDKTDGIDHVVDAARYPVGFFSPAAKQERSFNKILINHIN